MATSPQRQADAPASARHELPTHLQVEDHLIAGLTIRQTLLLSAGVSLGYSLWRHLAGVQASIHAALAPTHLTGLAALFALATRLALAALPLGVFALLALARPADRPLEEWLILALRYLTLPKTLVWRSTGAAPANAGAGLMASVPTDTGADDEDDDEDEEDAGEHDEKEQTSPRSSMQTRMTLHATARGGFQR